MKGTLVYHFGIIRNEEWQNFDGILCDVHEKYNQEGALRNTTAHWSGLKKFSTDVYYYYYYSRPVQLGLL